jgi:hypothetical protein
VPLRLVTLPGSMKGYCQKTPVCHREQQQAYTVTAAAARQ